MMPSVYAVRAVHRDRCDKCGTPLYDEMDTTSENERRTREMIACS